MGQAGGSNHGDDIYRPVALTSLLRSVHSWRVSTLGLRTTSDPPSEVVRGKKGKINESSGSARALLTHG